MVDDVKASDNHEAPSTSKLPAPPVPAKEPPKPVDNAVKKQLAAARSVSSGPCLSMNQHRPNAYQTTGYTCQLPVVCFPPPSTSTSRYTAPRSRPIRTHSHSGQGSSNACLSPTSPVHILFKIRRAIHRKCPRLRNVV